MHPEALLVASPFHIAARLGDAVVVVQVIG